jgi:hypothetical protein
MISVGTADQFVRELQKLQSEQAHPDFHTHGSPGRLALGETACLSINDLDKLRNKGFEGLFAAGALINFLGCDAAQFDPSKSGTSDGTNDGELFLAEFACIFLKRNGGRAVGSNQYWEYSKLGASYKWYVGAGFWKNDGTPVIAEVAPGASRAVLKGNYWLDEPRIRQQISLDMRYLENRQQAMRAQPGLQVEELLHTYNGALRLFDTAEAYLRGPSPVPYASLDKAVVTIENAEILLRAKGSPLNKTWLF